MARLSKVQAQQARADRERAEREAADQLERQRRRQKEDEAKIAHKKRLKESSKRLRKEAANMKDRERHQRNAEVRHPQPKPVTGKHALGALAALKRSKRSYVDVGKGKGRSVETIIPLYRTYPSKLGDQRIKEEDVLKMEAQGLDVQAEINKAVEQAIVDSHREAVISSGVLSASLEDK